jgi:hypothetical protein
MMRGTSVNKKADGETGDCRLSCALSKVGAFGTVGMDFYVFLLGADELLPCLAQLTAPPNNHMQNDTFHGFVVSCFRQHVQCRARPMITPSGQQASDRIYADLAC